MYDIQVLDQRSIIEDYDTISRLPKIVYDNSELSNFFGAMQLAPKFQMNEITAHGLMSYIYNTALRSSTHQSCLRFLNRFAFGGSLSVQFNSIPNFDDEIRQVSNSEKQQFLKVAKSIDLDFVNIEKSTTLLNQSLVESGDAYLYLKIQKVSNSYSVVFEAIPYSEFMYWVDENMNVLGGVWAKEFSVRAFSLGKYVVSNVTPYNSRIYNFSENRDGSISTIVHLKNANNTQLYGNLNIEAVLNALRVENQQGNFFVVADKNALTAKHILYEPAQISQMTNEEELEYKRAKREGLSKVATVQGGKDASNIVLSTYAPDENGKPILFNLNVSRDSEWQKTKSEWAKSAICGFHNVPADLLAIEKASASLGSDTIINSLLKCDAISIQPLQSQFEAFWSYIFNIIAIQTNNTILSNYTIKFKDNIKPLIQNINDSTRNSRNNQTVQSPIV